MSSLSNVLSCQWRLASTLAHMVEVARAKQWDRLPALDTQCTALADQLWDMGAHDLSAPERARFLALARRIRADQDELTSLVRPQFMSLMRKVAELQE
jgi:flagellar protein FliT